MQEKIYSGKYGLMDLARECENLNIKALFALSDMGHLDVRTIERILSDETVLTTRSIVSFVCAVDKLFNFVGKLISETSKINVACLCKMHSIMDANTQNSSGVLRLDYIPEDYRGIDYPAAISRQELQTKLDIIQSNQDKRQSAKDMFKLIMRVYPFYTWNVIIAFMATEVILIKYDVGFIKLGDEAEIDKLAQACQKLSNGKEVMKQEVIIDEVLELSIHRKEITEYG